MAKVPKGFLRHYVLKLLDEQPRSGSEIMSAIAERTEQRWEPSPGSVYPLLSWLHDSGYTRIADDQESGIKRYELTESGKEFLKEHDDMHPEFDETVEDVGPRFRGGKKLPDEARELFRSFRKIRKTSWKIFDTLRHDYSENLVKETKAAVDEFIAKLEILAEKKEA
ncbi:MAG: PadR family transcriptional regulator [Candidatus Thorarchaeota archaeon]